MSKTPLPLRALFRLFFLKLVQDFSLQLEEKVICLLLSKVFLNTFKNTFLNTFKKKRRKKETFFFDGVYVSRIIFQAFFENVTLVSIKYKQILLDNIR